MDKILVVSDGFGGFNCYGTDLNNQEFTRHYADYSEREAKVKFRSELSYHDRHISYLRDEFNCSITA